MSNLQIWEIELTNARQRVFKVRGRKDLMWAFLTDTRDTWLLDYHEEFEITPWTGENAGWMLPGIYADYGELEAYVVLEKQDGATIDWVLGHKGTWVGLEEVSDPPEALPATVQDHPELLALIEAADALPTEGPWTAEEYEERLALFGVKNGQMEITRDQVREALFTCEPHASPAETMEVLEVWKDRLRNAPAQSAPAPSTDLTTEEFLGRIMVSLDAGVDPASVMTAETSDEDRDRIISEMFEDASAPNKPSEDGEGE